MFWGCNDIPAKVKLIDLSEGDDVDSLNVTAADLNRRVNMVQNGQIQLGLQLEIKLQASQTV